MWLLRTVFSKLLLFARDIFSDENQSETESAKYVENKEQNGEELITDDEFESDIVILDEKFRLIPPGELNDSESKEFYVALVKFPIKCSADSTTDEGEPKLKRRKCDDQGPAEEERKIDSEHRPEKGMDSV